MNIQKQDRAALHVYPCFILGFAWVLSIFFSFGTCQSTFTDLYPPPPDSPSFDGAVALVAVFGVLGSILSIAIVVAICWCLCNLNERTKEMVQSLPSAQKIRPTTSPPASDILRLCPIEVRDRLKQLQFAYAEVLDITNDLRVKLGQGGFGPVYYGKLKDGLSVAVKKLSSISRQGTQEFLNEVEILSRAHHKNLVLLVGYCCEGDERCLIYEFMPKGNLDDRLHARRKDELLLAMLGLTVHAFPSLSYGTTVMFLIESGLPSEQEPLKRIERLKIAVGAAKGFSYLHNDCSPAIIHRDVKSSNILLDVTLRAKVADFGLSKLFSQSDLTHITTGVKGTFGYLDPEYAQTKRLTEKSDVYAFGVILLELLTGNKAIMHHDGEYVHIAQWAKPHIEARALEKILDKKMGENMNKEAVQAVANIAWQCVASKSTDRPFVHEVLQVLEAALNVEMPQPERPPPIAADVSVDINTGVHTVIPIIGGGGNVSFNVERAYKTQ